MRLPLLISALVILNFHLLSQAHESTNRGTETDSEFEIKVPLFSGSGRYRHPETATINGWLMRFGAEHGIRCDVTEYVKDLNSDVGAIFGLHAFLVHQTKWPCLLDLAGCDFDSHSEFLKAKVMVDPTAIDHPKGFGSEFWHTADWTNHTRKAMGKDHPIACTGI
jgi:uncharacterized protein